MNPAIIDEMGWAMAEVYGSVTDRILANIAKYFPYIEQGKEPKRLFDYQVKKLAEMGQLTSETVDIIANSLGGADAMLRQELETAIRVALKDVDPVLRKAAEQGLLNGPGFVPPELSPSQMTAFTTYYRQSADKLNFVNTVMLESTQAAYTQTVSDIVNRVQRTQGILNAAAGELVTGVSAWNTAMHDAVQRMVNNGLTGFIDHAGHRWSPEAYVAMDIRTTLHNTANAAVWERQEEYGSDIYQVSTHNGARPLCYPWQGKLISRNDVVQEVPDFDGVMQHVYAQSETTYGQAAGLFGVNCGHYPIPFVPGFSRMRGNPQSEEENAKTYEESQKQRELERKLRKEKLDLEVMKAQGAPADEIKAQRARVKKASDDIATFCDETGRTRRRNREYTPVNATFPPKDSYDPATFPTDERDRINDWFRNGGDNPPQNPSGASIGPDGIPPQGQAQTPSTLQMHDQAMEWATDNYYAELDELEEGYAGAPEQLRIVKEFRAEIPTYEGQLREAVTREDFSIRTTSEATERVLRDGRFKSQIETGTSNGLLDVEKRKRAAQSLFAYDEPIEIGPTEYEIYGYLDKAPRANMYGDTRFVLKKDRLIDRTTLTVGDSLELLETGADPIASKATDPKIMSYGRVFGSGVLPQQGRLDETRRQFNAIGQDGHLDLGNYVELQFHGGVTLDDVAYIVVSRSAYNADEIATLAKEKGVEIRWTR